MWIHGSLHMLECRDESEIYNYQRIHLLNNKFINVILGVHLTWLDGNISFIWSWFINWIVTDPVYMLQVKIIFRLKFFKLAWFPIHEFPIQFIIQTFKNKQVLTELFQNGQNQTRRLHSRQTHLRNLQRGWQKKKRKMIKHKIQI